MSPLRRGLFNRRVVRKALATPVDPQFIGWPPPRVLLGLALLGVSYLMCWPAIVALGAVAAWLRKPELLLGGPLLYGFSWLLFVAGLALLGKHILADGPAFFLFLVRRFAEKFLMK